MNKKPSKLLMLLSSVVLTFCLISSNLVANDFSSRNDSEYILAPKCFIENNAFQYTELAANQQTTNKEMILFKVNKNSWWQSLNKINHTKDCGKFLNVTDDWVEYISSKTSHTMRVSELDYNYFLANILHEDNIQTSKSSYKNIKSVKLDSTKEEVIQKLFNQIDQERISKSLDLLSTHYNRVAYSDDGYKAAVDIENWMEELAKETEKSETEFRVEYISTNDYYKQPSVVAVLGPELPGDALIITAHMDTNGGGRRPGADDDGSGSMVVLETARILAAANLELKRPVYFMWFAAEEMGLVGSKKVSKEFQDRGVGIDSVLHFDTIGRRASANDPTLFLLRDNVDQSFTDYLSNIIKTYLKLPVDNTRCGYACSDHVNWTRKGYTAAAAFESRFSEMNPYLHTSKDTRQEVYMENLINFTKLSLAYVVDKNIGFELESTETDSDRNKTPENK